MTTPYYTYHEEAIFIPKPIHYNKMLNMKKHSGKNQLKTYKESWIRTLIYYYPHYSDADIYEEAKILGCTIDDIDNDIKYESLLSIIKRLRKEVKYFNDNTNTNRFLFKTKVRFIWNKWKMEEIEIQSGSTAVKQFKRQMISKHNHELISKKKTSLVLEIVNNNVNINRTELISTLKGKVSQKTIDKILSENNITLSKKTKSSIEIEKKLYDLFKYRIDSVSERLTNENLAQYCKVSLNTFKRFIKNNNEYKIKIENFNKKRPKFK